MKKVVYGLLVGILVCGLVGCSSQSVSEEKKTDAIRFKEEYESLNGEKNDSNEKMYRTVSIPEENPFVYETADGIVKRMEEKESFLVYFGFKSCPWCRSILAPMLEAASDLAIDKIYYVDVKDIRDTITIDSEGNPVTTKEGEEGYDRLLELLESVLEDYTVTDENGETQVVGKRIYAPNVIAVISGTPEKMTSGISEQETDPYMELSEEILEDSYSQLECVFKCFTGDTKTCSLERGC